MKKSDLIELLSSADEEDVAIKVDGVIYDEIEVDHEPEAFDGFFTSYPATVTLSPKFNPEND
jgi:hypothetical protein